MMYKYILDEQGNPVPVEDVIEWGKWFETADRHIGKDTIGDVTVSTVFLGIDHSYGTGAPVLFETMVFGGVHDGYQDRYTTRWEALIGHIQVVKMVKDDMEF
jgi:hypothetical protein